MANFCRRPLFKAFQRIIKLSDHNITLPEYGRGAVYLVLQQQHRFNTDDAKSEKLLPATQEEIVEEDDPTKVERFIPLTRWSIFRYMMQQKDFLSEEERKMFEEFSSHLDSAVENKFLGVRQELKSLFDPINPDKDTVATRQWNRRERLDNEFWLMQKLTSIMEKANFREIPKHIVEKALAEHTAAEGVLVSVNPDKYDILRFWALGREAPPPQLPVTQKIYHMITRKPVPDPMEYFKRVVVAVRLKKDQKLTLKIFKEVPTNALEQLLPDGKIKMSRLDRGVLVTSAGIASFGVLAKAVTYLANYPVNWTLILTGVTGLIGVRAWTVYKNRRNSYLVQLNRMLYFKNIANNRALLTHLVDRAEDETYKEALLTYTCLLTNRPPSLRDVQSSQQLPAELGGIPSVQLERHIEEWVRDKTSTSIEFDCEESVKLLDNFGILTQSDDKLNVVPLDTAIRTLPDKPITVLERADEHDIVEGYDRAYYKETEEKYKEEDKKNRKFGWF